jgi:hypothetical protein
LHQEGRGVDFGSLGILVASTYIGEELKVADSLHDLSNLPLEQAQ